MEFNEYIRWTANDLEKTEMAVWACNEMYRKTNDNEWFKAAMSIRYQADIVRAETVRTWGWYLV